MGVLVAGSRVWSRQPLEGRDEQRYTGASLSVCGGRVRKEGIIYSGVCMIIYSTVGQGKGEGKEEKKE